MYFLPLSKPETNNNKRKTTTKMESNNKRKTTKTENNNNNKRKTTATTTTKPWEPECQRTDLALLFRLRQENHQRPPFFGIFSFMMSSTVAWGRDAQNPKQQHNKNTLKDGTERAEMNEKEEDKRTVTDL